MDDEGTAKLHPPGRRSDDGRGIDLSGAALQSHPVGTRLEILGSTVSSLAYELNNLMTIALAGVERARTANDPAQCVIHLNRAEAGIRRAGRLTEQMLSCASSVSANPPCSETRPV